MGAAESKTDDTQIVNEIVFDSDPPRGRRCDIIVVGSKSGDDSLTELRWLPKEAHIVGTNLTIEDFDFNGIDLSDANVLLNSQGNAATLAPIIARMPKLEWIHSMTAGIDHILFPELINDEKVIMTNAKGIFSSSLAEYVMGVCAYFSKDFPRLIQQKSEHKWDRFCVTELRGQTMGILGYGDIGRACAALAKAYGMRVIATRRRPELSQGDPLVDRIYGSDGVCDVMAASDYVVLVAALTPETRGMVGENEFSYSKIGQVFINIGRGPLVNEEALINCLVKQDRLRGAALDVFDQEPLPPESPLWDCPNLLLSPHNADMTVNFRHRSVKFFTENCDRFLNSSPLESVVDKRLGY